MKTMDNPNFLENSLVEHVAWKTSSAGMGHRLAGPGKLSGNIKVTLRHEFIGSFDNISKFPSIV
jgi:hypothetical protein